MDLRYSALHGEQSHLAGQVLALFGRGVIPAKGS
jgi:hypothetical protein